MPREKERDGRVLLAETARRIKASDALRKHAHEPLASVRSGLVECRGLRAEPPPPHHHFLPDLHPALELSWALQVRGSSTVQLRSRSPLKLFFSFGSLVRSRSCDDQIGIVYDESEPTVPAVACFSPYQNCKVCGLQQAQTGRKGPKLNCCNRHTSILPAVLVLVVQQWYSPGTVDQKQRGTALEYRRVLQPVPPRQTCGSTSIRTWQRVEA
jgi:hypothetical protein